MAGPAQTRMDHLLDLEARLKADAPLVAHIPAIAFYRSRAAQIPVGVRAAVMLYAPEENGAPLSAGGVPQYPQDLTIAIEVRIMKLDDWDIEAGVITELIKSALFTDPVWLSRWKSNPSFTVRQFLEAKPEQVLCGEVISLNVTDRIPHQYAPVHSALTGIDLAVDLIDNGGPDDEIEVTSKIDVPPVV